jgi:hypothetical protein
VVGVIDCPRAIPIDNRIAINVEQRPEIQLIEDELDVG